MHEEPLFISWNESDGEFNIHTLKEMLEANQTRFNGGSPAGFAPIAIAESLTEAEQIVDTYEKGLAVKVEG